MYVSNYMIMLHHFSTYTVLAPIEGSVSYLILYNFNDFFLKLQNQIMKRYVYEDILLHSTYKQEYSAIYLQEK